MKKLNTLALVFTIFFTSITKASEHSHNEVEFVRSSLKEAAYQYHKHHNVSDFLNSIKNSGFKVHKDAQNYIQLNLEKDFPAIGGENNAIIFTFKDGDSHRLEFHSSNETFTIYLNQNKVELQNEKSLKAIENLLIQSTQNSYKKMDSLFFHNLLNELVPTAHAATNWGAIASALAIGVGMYVALKASKKSGRVIGGAILGAGAGALVGGAFSNENNSPPQQSNSNSH